MMTTDQTLESTRTFVTSERPPTRLSKVQLPLAVLLFIGAAALMAFLALPSSAQVAPRLAVGSPSPDHSCFGGNRVTGEILREFDRLGACRSFLGAPLNSETATPDGKGRFNHFQGGSIYWHPATGAHELHGAIREKWKSLGWERSFLGYPTTDETATPDGKGRFNHFQGGSIYWHPTTGTRVERHSTGETVNISVPKSAVVAAFNTALSGTRIRIHNYGEQRKWSWLSQQSHVLLPTGARVNFEVPEISLKLNNLGRTLKIYVRDFVSSSLDVHVDGSRLNLVVQFESEGQELATRCIRRAGPARNRHWKECSLKIERDVHLNNARVEISMLPTAYNGSLSYRSPNAQFLADVDLANRWCSTFAGACDFIEDLISRTIYSNVQKSLVKTLDRDDLKQRVADGVRKAISPWVATSWRVTSVRSSGNHFIVTAVK